jgi:hypothetical protein
MGYNITSESRMSDATELLTVKWAEFLASIPPDSTARIPDLCHQQPGNNLRWTSRTPDIFLYCDSDECQGHRFFQCYKGTIYVQEDTWKYDFLHFSCRNCRKNYKSYAVAVKQNADGASGVAIKLGEIPPFGPHIPARVISLIGPDRELFLRGRRAENRGLGIGAFSYYRRVVENQKSRIILQIAKVAEKLGANPGISERFKGAAKETQFSKAIDEIRGGFPSVLLIDGQHNPLTLLHGALSEGLHDHTDEECLEIAKEIRLVLTELADRISQALKEEAELTKAVSRLLSRKTTSPSGAASSSGTKPAIENDPAES